MRLCSILNFSAFQKHPLVILFCIWSSEIAAAVPDLKPQLLSIAVLLQPHMELFSLVEISKHIYSVSFGHHKNYLWYKSCSLWWGFHGFHKYDLTSRFFCLLTSSYACLHFGMALFLSFNIHLDYSEEFCAVLSEIALLESHSIFELLYHMPLAKYYKKCK